MIHMIGNKHSGYGPDGRRLYFKGGGGGGQVKYDNLEQLYEEQAASARLLRGIAETNLPGATDAYVGEVQNVLAPDFADRRANLAGADLNGLSGLNDWIKCIQVEDWPITYTSDVMQIGCQRHIFDAWRNFSDAEIRAMDGRKALAFWTKWKAAIFQIIEMAPAKPTKPVEDTGASA